MSSHRLLFAALTLAALPLAAAGQSFAPAVDFGVGLQPSGLAVADFNGDGRPDFATSNASAGTVTVRLGDGLGGFLPTSTYPVDYTTEGFAAGDMNGDGAPDLVVSSRNVNGEGRLVVLRNANNGTGSFVVEPAFSVGYAGFGAGVGVLALGDLDGDHDLDAAIGARFGNYAYIARNDGAGHFLFPVAIVDTVVFQCTQFGCLNVVSSLSIGDVDEDGDLDLALVNLGKSLALLTNDGHAAFTLAETAQPSSDLGAVVLADVTDDGHLDQLVPTWQGVNVFVGAGDGHFAAPVLSLVNGVQGPFVNGPLALALADLDGNGTLDLAGTHTFGNIYDVLIAKGDGAGSFAQVAGAGLLSAAAMPIASADFDGDGRPDLLAAESGDGLPIPSTVALLRNVTVPAAPWTDLQSGLAGGKGKPWLMPKGSLQAGAPCSFALTSAKPLAPTFLVIGLSAVHAPLKGGVLVPAPDVVVAGAQVEPDAELVLTAPWPAGVPSGQLIVAQWWVVDAGAPQGLAASNAVQAFTP